MGEFLHSVAMKCVFSFSETMSFLGPTLFVSLGYLDPGNWATAIEAGSRFGFELLWVIIISNVVAILFQYLAAQLGLVTGRDLAQVCRDEYPQAVSLTLWLLCEVSLVAVDMTMILGTAVGLNLLLGLPIVPGVMMVAVDALFLMVVLPLMGVRRAEFLPILVIGLVLLCLLVNALLSKPSASLILSGLWPRLKNDNIYVAISLLGANIMPHNLYLHSALIKVQRRPGSPTVDVLRFHNFFDIAVVITTVSLVNTAILVAATASHNAGLSVLTLQDAHVLMGQALSHSLAPLALGLALLCGGLLSTLPGTIGGQVAIKGFAGVKVDPWLHRLIVRIAAVIPAIFCAWMYGNEGIYRMVVFCQVLLALQLPFTMVVLIKATSSQACMGAYKTHVAVEASAWVSVVGIVLMNLWFALTMLFGESDEWVSATNWEIIAGLDWLNIRLLEALHTILLVLILVVIGISVGFLVWLTLAPLKLDILSRNHCTNLNTDPNASTCKIQQLSKVDVDVKDGAEMFFATPSEARESAVKESSEMPQFHTPQEPVHDHLSSEGGAEEIKSLLPIETCSTVTDVSGDAADAVGKSLDSEMLITPSSREDMALEEKAPEKIIELCTNSTSLLDKDDEELDIWENLEQEDLVGDVLSGLGETATYDGPESGRSIEGRSEMGEGTAGNSGSLSRLSGLGRAARRQFAAVLDEFWGNLFDLHGQPTGLTKTHAQVQSQMSLSGSRSQSLEAYGEATNNERRYSSMRLPAYHEEYDYQPATIHGYNIASFARNSNIGSGSKARSSYLDVQPIGSRAGQPALGQFSRSGLPGFDVEQSKRHFEHMYGGMGRSGVSPSYSGRSYQTVGHSVDSSFYNSSSHGGHLDGVSMDSWNSLVSRATGELGTSNSGGYFSANFSQSPIGKDLDCQGEKSPLAFDAISPSQMHKDGFSIQSSSQFENSLWSRQPFEQLFGMSNASTLGTSGPRKPTSRPKSVLALSNGVEFSIDVLQSLRVCLEKLLRLEGSEWLFRMDTGCDEDLIGTVATQVKSLLHSSPSLELSNTHGSGGKNRQAHFHFPTEMNGQRDILSSSAKLVSRFPDCGEGCIWNAGLLISFGVWCVHRVLELSLMESRPELWGKYTYVLNRLQGILDPAFSSPRNVQSFCFCLQIDMQSNSGSNQSSLYRQGSFTSCVNGGLCSPTASQSRNYPNSWPSRDYRGKGANATVFLEMIKDVEIAVGSRKGRTGTAAGDVAFPKGKENLASVLKRYKRRLGKKPGPCNGSGRKSSGPISAGLLQM